MVFLNTTSIGSEITLQSTFGVVGLSWAGSFLYSSLPIPHLPLQTNKNLRCGNRKGLLGRNDQTHHRMGPKTMESIPPSKRNTQADIQLRTRQTNHQQETDGCIQIKHNPEHQPSRMSSKSTAYVPPKTASTPTKANTQTCSYLDFNQFLIRRITRNICH